MLDTPPVVVPAASAGSRGAGDARTLRYSHCVVPFCGYCRGILEPVTVTLNRQRMPLR